MPCRLAIVLSVVALVAPLYAAPPDFDRTVAPILAKCLDCHTGADAKGKYDLSRKQTALGAITAGKPDDSEMWRRVSTDEMPPKKPLSAADKQTLKAWIESGAKWGTDPIDPIGFTTADRGGRDWWAFQPLRKPAVPASSNSIDAFVLARLVKAGLKPSPPAEPRTLIRRVYLDLIGLPPSPEEVEAFVKNPSEEAYLKVVDRLLASPHYGERWARHWLDLVRYAESDGFERNNPRPNAWPYRDWVIRALNADLPFDQFAKLQIAGDALKPDYPSAIAATGFLVAGTHNTVLGSNKIANDTARQDELEDIIAAVGQTFLGLTVQCARCHDHKFDPVTQTDYYRLAAALAGVNHGERAAVSAAWLAERKKTEADLRKQIADLRTKVAGVERAGRERVLAKGVKNKPTLPVEPIARWTFETDAKDEFGKLDGALHGGAEVKGGRAVFNGKSAFVRTKPLAADVTEKTLEAWVALPTLDQKGGGVLTVETGDGTVFDSIVFGERQPKQWMAGSEFYRRTRDLNAPAETTSAAALVHTAITYSADGRIQVYRNGQAYGPSYTSTDAGVRTYKAGDARLLFGLRHTGGGNAYLTGEVEEARLYDRALTAEQVAESAKAGPGGVTVSRDQMLAALTDAEKADRDRWTTELARADKALAALTPPQKVYTVVSVKPPATHVLARGNVEQKKAEVTAGGPACVPGVADFGLKADASDGLRRAKLAEWIARPDNPLFSRVIVNRLWHHHFGVGLVDTPSDFGFNGGRPSHPELLDWLAAELVTWNPERERQGDVKDHPVARAPGSNWSLKHIHCLIVTSATYRQSSARNPKALAVDADNRLLWRKSPTRIDAEVLRDSILTVSGQLNPKAGGPGFHDVRTYGDSGTLYYEPIDKFDETTNRRTVYRFSPRGERSAVLETFDCPDPSALTPRRMTTTTPLQALALWNDAFVLAMADKFAARVAAEAKTTADRVERAYRLALGRAPTADEAKAATALADKHGLAAVARVMFNCNEFVVIE